MESKKELQKEIDKCVKTGRYITLDIFYTNVKDIVSRMPDDDENTKLKKIIMKTELIKPEPSLLEVAMHFYKSDGMKVSFDIAEKLIAENERRKK